MKVTYLYAAQHLDERYLEACVEQPCNRLKYLARISNALDKSQDIITSETVKNFGVLASRAQRWGDMQLNLTKPERDSLAAFISMLNLAEDAFSSALINGMNVSEILEFAPEDIPTFDAVTDALNAMRSTATTVVSMQQLAKIAPEENMGNMFAFYKYEAGRLVYYPADPEVNNPVACSKTSYYAASSFSEFGRLVQWLIDAAAKVPQLQPLVNNRLQMLQHIMKNFEDSACVVYFTDGIEKYKVPFKLASKSKVNGIQVSSFLDKISSKRVTVYIV